MLGCFVLLMSILDDSWGKGSKVPFPNELLVDRILHHFFLCHAGIENVPPPIAVAELFSSSGKSTTFLNFSFVIN